MRCRVYMSALLAIGLVLFFGSGTPLANEPLDIRRAQFGISLGSDAYFIQMHLGRGAPSTVTQLPPKPNALVPPGTLLMVFHGNSILVPGKGRRYLALTEFGDWLLVPGDPSNLVRENTIFHAIMNRPETDDREWYAFFKNVRTPLPSVEFTSGEIIIVSRNSDIFTAHVQSDDAIMGDKFDQIAAVEGAAEYLENGALVIPLNQNDNAFVLRLPIEKVVGYFNVVGLKRIGIEDPDERHSLTPWFLWDLLWGGGHADTILERPLTAEERFLIFDAWPKTVMVDTLFEFDCSVKSAEQVRSLENAVRAKLGLGLEIPLSGVSAKVGVEIERETTTGATLSVSFSPQQAVSEAALVHLNFGDEKIVTFAQAAACDGTQKSRPVWYKMHWEGNPKYLFDRRNYEEGQWDGLHWNDETGWWEISCFAGTYDYLVRLLSRGNETNVKAAQAFLIRNLRAKEGRWRAVFTCESPGPPAIEPRPRPDPARISLRQGQ